MQPRLSHARDAERPLLTSKVNSAITSPQQQSEEDVLSAIINSATCALHLGIYADVPCFAQLIVTVLPAPPVNPVSHVGTVAETDGVRPAMLDLLYGKM